MAADFAFIPFGGGARKCVGDQFALLEATVALAMLLRQDSSQYVVSVVAAVLSDRESLNIRRPCKDAQNKPTWRDRA